MNKTFKTFAEIIIGVECDNNFFVENANSDDIVNKISDKIDDNTDDENITKSELMELIDVVTDTDETYLNKIADCILDLLDELDDEPVKDDELNYDDIPGVADTGEINEIIYKNAVHHKRRKQRAKKMKPSERRKQRLKYKLTKFKKRAEKRRKKKAYRTAVKKGRHIPQKRVKTWQRQK